MRACFVLSLNLISVFSSNFIGTWHVRIFVLPMCLPTWLHLIAALFVSCHLFKPVILLKLHIFKGIDCLHVGVQFNSFFCSLLVMERWEHTYTGVFFVKLKWQSEENRFLRHVKSYHWGQYSVTQPTGVTLIQTVTWSECAVLVYAVSYL